MKQISGVEYAASAFCDLLVAQTVDLVNKLAFTAAGIDYMGVGVAERREYISALGVDTQFSRFCLRT